MQEPLERFDRRQAREQPALLVGGERLAMLAGFDHLAQPEALLVAPEVLELVRDGAAVDVLQRRVGLGEGLPRDIDAQHLGRDLRHVLGCQAERSRIERRIAGGLGAQRIEPRREVPEAADRFHERHRGGDMLQVVERREWGTRERDARFSDLRFDRSGGGRRPHRFSRKTQTVEHGAVEPLFPLQQRLEPLQEQSRIRRPGSRGGRTCS